MGSATALDVSPATQRSAVAPPAVAAELDGLAGRIADRTAIVAVVGLGYVGVPLLVAAGLEGFPVVGVDTDARKVQTLRERRSYVVDVSDEDLAALHRTQFTTDPRVLMVTDVVVIAVPTPLRDSVPDLSMITSAAQAVSATLRPGQLVILESTTYPGTTEDVVRPILENTGLTAGRDFALVYSPERIDPGSGRTLRATPKVVAGVTPLDTDLAARFYRSIVDTVVPLSSPRNAEMAKLIENTFRQVNIALVNELATIAPAIGVDIWEALDGAATKPFGYLPFWPGPGVGGHCIAIDPSYLSWQVEQRLGFGIGFVHHARSVNNRMPVHVASRIAEALNGVGKAVRGARVLVLGLAYKPGVDDVRESPQLLVLERLLAAGAQCSYHDPHVATVRVDVPVPTELTSSPLTAAVLQDADCAVILTAHPEIDYASVVARAPLVFDATGVTRSFRADHVVLL